MKNLTILTICFLLTCAGHAFAGIAFVANVDGNWDLFLADDNGKNPVRLTNTLYDEKDPCLSWDKKSIVYATSDGHLNIVDIDSRETFQIAVGKSKTPKISPCFSPDGKEIAFAANFMLKMRPDIRHSTGCGICQTWTKASMC